MKEPPLINARAHELAITVPAAPLAVHGDYSRVAQILANLLNNAAKYTEPKGRISLGVEEDGADVVFRVRDSGIGIPRNMLGSIFELFTQADRSLDRTQGGLGIGLTIVRRLVSMQGGSVQVYSDGAEKGSEFVVRLPRAVRSAEPPQADASGGNAAGHRVLIVDDYADAAASMAALLRLTAGDVRIAHDGPPALSKRPAASSRPWCFSISDAGHTDSRWRGALRAMPEAKDCLLIAVSGYGRPKTTGIRKQLIRPPSCQTGRSARVTGNYGLDESGSVPASGGGLAGHG